MSSGRPSGPLIPGLHVAYRDTKSGGVLVNMITGTCFELNHVAAHVWKHLVEGEAPERVALAISSLYQAPLGAVLADVHRICDDFVVANLVERRDK